MKIASRELLYTEHSKYNKPGIYVNPREDFFVETELCSGDWLHSIMDKWDLSKEKGPNPTVCIGINEAKPGDILAVKILDIELDRVGYTGFDGRNQILPYLIHQKEWKVVTKTLEIKNDFIIWDEKLKIPVSPMIGTIGTAPEHEVVRNSKAGNHGGNMDVNEITCGSTLYLPVFIEGALLHIGDVHAIQGDGEINHDGGVECRARVKLNIEVKEKPQSMEWVRLEDNNHIMTIACCRSLEESFYAAAKELMLWMCQDYDFTEEDAYLLMGQLMLARCTQFVNPTRTYICKMPKAYLK